MAGAVASLVVDALMPGNLRAALLLSLLIAAAFTGCFDKKDGNEPEDKEALFVRPDDDKRSMPMGEFQRTYGSVAPEECDGCIPLTPEKKGHVPPPPPPAILVPYPKSGDVLRVEGNIRMGEGRSQPLMPVDERSGHYNAIIQVRDNGSAGVRFEVEPIDGHWINQPLPLDVFARDWNVSQASRGVISDHTKARIQVDGAFSDDHWIADLTHQPDLETLYWLGAHVWGRALHAGDTFTTHWVLPGGFQEVVRFDHYVEVAQQGAIPTTTLATQDPSIHIHQPFRYADLSIRVTATAGETVWSWTFVFDDSSPYPLSITTLKKPFASPYHSPMDVADQHIDVLSRGDGDIAWAPTPSRPLASGPTDPASTFVVGERLAPAALDALPAYPLSAALSDLRLRGDYDAYASSNPRRVLVEATHEVQYLRDGPGTTRHVWTLRFTDRAGTIDQWTVARLGTPAGLLPAADQIDHVHHPTTDELVRWLGDHPDQPIRIASGRLLTDTVDQYGWDHADRLGYTLEWRGGADGGVGARLWVAAMLLPFDPTATAELGYVEEDLGAQRIVTEGRFYDP